MHSKRRLPPCSVSSVAFFGTWGPSFSASAGRWCTPGPSELGAGEAEVVAALEEGRWKHSLEGWGRARRLLQACDRGGEA